MYNFVSECCKFLEVRLCAISQTVGGAREITDICICICITEKSNLSQIEIILHIVLKCQFNRTCFPRGEASTSVSLNSHIVSASPVQTQ